MSFKKIIAKVLFLYSCTVQGGSIEFHRTWTTTSGEQCWSRVRANAASSVIQWKGDFDCTALQVVEERDSDPLGYSAKVVVINSRKKLDAIRIALRLHQNWKKDPQYAQNYLMNLVTEKSFEDCFIDPEITEEVLRAIYNLGIPGHLAKFFAAYITIHQKRNLADEKDVLNIMEAIGRLALDGQTSMKLLALFPSDTIISLADLKRA